MSEHLRARARAPREIPERGGGAKLMSLGTPGYKAARLFNSPLEGECTRSTEWADGPLCRVGSCLRDSSFGDLDF